MSTIHFKLTTTATPEQFIAGLTDFGPGRDQLFGNSTDQYLKVHAVDCADRSEDRRSPKLHRSGRGSMCQHAHSQVVQQTSRL